MSRARRAQKPRLGKQVTRAAARNCKVAPRKVRAVADLLRGLTVSEALAQLGALHRPSAVPLLTRLLKSAFSNANPPGEHNYTEADLFIGVIMVDGGRIETRYRPRAMGRATVIRKRSSHVTVELYARP